MVNRRVYSSLLSAENKNEILDEDDKNLRNVWKTGN